MKIQGTLRRGEAPLILMTKPAKDGRRLHPQFLKNGKKLCSLLLFLLVFSGCASAQSQQPLTTQPLHQSRAIRGSTAIPPPVAVQDETEALPRQGGTEPSPLRKSKPSSASALENETSPIAQMLRSASRSPSPAAQPEADFHLQLPAHIDEGKAFSLEFGAAGAQRIRLLWRGKSLDLPSPNPRSKRFQALLPVPLDEKAKSLPLHMSVQWAGGKREEFTASLPVHKHNYPVQKLNVASKYVSPPPEMEEKIKRDRAEMRGTVTKVTPRQFWSLPLLRPVSGAVTSLYGLRRVYNGVPKSPHKGLDLDAEAGDAIHAADNGIVSLVSDHYYGGKTLVIDHGLGVFTVYLHLSAFHAAAGQTVKRGDVIGAIGNTGRSTAPHLHLSLYVLGESVDIVPCMEAR